MKTVFDNVASGFGKLGSSIKSMLKVAIQSRKVEFKRQTDDQRIIILGNGPSLLQTIAENPEALSMMPKLAVNFAANAPQFDQLRPDYYVLADPHFFVIQNDENVKRLFSNISAVSWPMTLFVPASVKNFEVDNPNVAIQRFNPVGAEGWEWLENALFKSGRAMPRPRNVLIPSIMIALNLGYKEVYLTGADHSWTRTLSVSDENEVVSIQPHFYKENDKEQARISHDYLNYRLHDILYSFYVAFRSYFAIDRYARHIGAKVYNSTPGSFIDAFERRPLPKH